MRLAGVLDDDQVVLPGNIENGIHLRGLPVEVDRDNALYDETALGMHKLATCGIEVALGLKIFAQPARIHVVSTLIDIDEVRPRSCLRNGLRCGNERVGDCDDNVAGTNTGGHQCKSNSICTTGDTDTELRATELGKLRLKLFHHWTPNKARGPQCGLKYSSKLLFELYVWRNKVKEWDFHVFGHSVAPNGEA